MLKVFAPDAMASVPALIIGRVRALLLVTVTGVELVSVRMPVRAVVRDRYGCQTW